MSFVMLFLARNPDVRRRIANDPVMIGDAIAEFLRRIPNFSVVPETPVSYVGGIQPYDLVW